MKGWTKIVVGTVVEIGLVFASGYVGGKIGEGIIEVLNR